MKSITFLLTILVTPFIIGLACAFLIGYDDVFYFAVEFLLATLVLGLLVYGSYIAIKLKRMKK